MRRQPLVFTLIKAVSIISTILMSSGMIEPDVDFKKGIAAAFNMTDARLPVFSLGMGVDYIVGSY